MRVRTPSRVHISLIDLNGSLARVDGGMGIALEEPCIELEVNRAEELRARGKLKEKAARAARGFFQHYGIEGGVEIDVIKSYPKHVGLGSGTQVALGVVRALAKLYGVKASIEELAFAAGRGGTSGIGTWSFERGGFILDGGHSVKEKEGFLPSRASRAEPPPLILREDFPWQVAVIFPKNSIRISGQREVDIFQEYCPIPGREVERLSRIILMQLLPALVEEDIETFGRAVNSIQKVGFKGVELALQPREVKKALRAAQEASYGAGLSSFGPVIYSLVGGTQKLERALEGKAEKIIYSCANNTGASVYEGGQI